MKLFTGGDEIATRNLYEKTFYFKPQFKMIFVLNELVDLILMKDMELFDQIRNIFFNLIITNFSGTDIVTNILIKLINNDRIKEKQKISIINICKDVEYNMIKCRREINQFDMLIVGIIDILNIK